MPQGAHTAAAILQPYGACFFPSGRFPAWLSHHKQQPGWVSCTLHLCLPIWPAADLCISHQLQVDPHACGTLSSLARSPTDHSIAIVLDPVPIANSPCSQNQPRGCAATRFVKSRMRSSAASLYVCIFRSPSSTSSRGRIGHHSKTAAIELGVPSRKSCFQIRRYLAETRACSLYLTKNPQRLSSSDAHSTHGQCVPTIKICIQGKGLTRILRSARALRLSGNLKLNSQQRDGRGATARTRLMRALRPCPAYLER
jgi:hypothetical protein